MNLSGLATSLKKGVGAVTVILGNTHIFDASLKSSNKLLFVICIITVLFYFINSTDFQLILEKCSIKKAIQ